MAETVSDTLPPTAPQLPAARRSRSSPVRSLRELAHLLAGLPLGLAAWSVATIGLVFGVGTLVVWIGVPVLAATLFASSGLAALERRSTEWATGTPLPPHHYRPVIGRGVAAVTRPLLDPQRWRDLLHAVVVLPLHLVAFVLALTWTLVGLAGVLSPAFQWALPDDDAGSENTGLFELVTGVESRFAEVVTTTVVGALLLVTAPFVLRGLTAVRAVLARVLLTNEAAALRAEERAALHARTAQLESSRRSAVAAEASMLRRLERDIHDGPQQRLVRMDMDLQTVARRLDDDPERARPLVAEAIAQNREALGELRALSRGIAPPVLADRGLGPALTAAAARCPVRVSLDVALPDGGRLPAAVENTAYFVVAEALTNVAKHADASACEVAVALDDERVLVRVQDDGRGGAHVGKGHGLAGLVERLDAVEGRLDVVSPVGGPTVLTAAIPVGGL